MIPPLNEAASGHGGITVSRHAGRLFPAVPEKRCWRATLMDEGTQFLVTELERLMSLPLGSKAERDALVCRIQEGSTSLAGTIRQP